MCSIIPISLWGTNRLTRRSSGRLRRRRGFSRGRFSWAKGFILGTRMSTGFTAFRRAQAAGQVNGRDRAGGRRLLIRLGGERLPQLLDGCGEGVGAFAHQ